MQQTLIQWKQYVKSVESVINNDTRTALITLFCCIYSQKMSHCSQEKPCNDVNPSQCSILLAFFCKLCNVSQNSLFIERLRATGSDTYEEFEKSHCVKSVRIRSFSGSHFPVFGLNTKRYSKYGHFSLSVSFSGNLDMR